MTWAIIRSSLVAFGYFAAATRPLAPVAAAVMLFTGASMVAAVTSILTETAEDGRPSPEARLHADPRLAS